MSSIQMEVFTRRLAKLSAKHLNTLSLTELVKLWDEMQEMKEIVNRAHTPRP